MKKIFMTVTVLLLVFMAFSCSKDHDAPTFGVYSAAKKPTNVDASFNQSTTSFDISWEMADDANVIDYYIVVSDSVNFNGTQITRSTGDIGKTFTMSADFITIPADVVDTYTTTRYFAVQAVYDVESTYFVGPRSDDTDSAEFVVTQ